MRPNIRPAESVDLAAVTTLDQRCFSDESWSAAAWSDEFARLGSDRVILVADEGEVVGYVVLLVPVSAEDPVDLLRIAVTPAERRTGIASQLMSAALSVGAGRDILLEVAAGNEAAVKLYQGYGFGEISRRAGYYAGGEDAVIMRRQEKDDD